MSSKMNDSLHVKVLKNLHCGSCNLQFFLKDFTLKGSRCPMLLHCGHSMCECCIQQNLKAAKVITCQQCGSVSSVESTEQSTKGFPLNIYLLGSLFALQNFKLEKDKRFASLTRNYGNFNYAVKGQTDLNLKPDLSKRACEECLLTALWYCENCKSNFCEICWSRVHGSARSLMKHCKAPVSSIETVKIALKKCFEHETQDLEFFCKGCSIMVCSHCVILQHQGEGHFPITLKEKNVEMISNIKTAAEEAERICKRMKQALEKLKLSQSSSEAPDAVVADLEIQITRNFSRIHGILQLEEDRLLRKLQENLKQRGNQIQALRLQLEEQIKTVEGLLRESELVAKTLQMSDLSDLHRQLKEVQNLPCYLVTQAPCDKEVKLAFDEKLIELLRLYCTMDVPSNEKFELRSSLNLPKDYAVEPLEASDKERTPKPYPELIVSDVDTLSNCSSWDLAKGVEGGGPRKPRKGPTVFLEKKSYSVQVSYIKTPGEFYVILNSQRSKQQAIVKKATQFAGCTFDVPEGIAKDEVYLVQYTVDNKWYRARVVEVLPSRKMGAEESVKVYYLDYGNSETVPVSRLRPIPRDMIEPPLAVKCRLFDCVPKNGEWCAESTKTMEKILKNYTATMFVMKVHRDCLEVDLSVIYPEGPIGRDIVSVRDALLFLEFSSFVHGSKISSNGTAFKYLQQSLPAAGETFDVIITHVNSPSDFYFQKAEDPSFLCSLAIDLDKYYSENSERGFIYNPTIGMACAALFSADQKWYRAKIVDFPGKKMVSVYYVDFGNRETVHWTWIRKLKESFVRRPALAFNCALSGIHPADGLWSLQAKTYLENCLMRSDYRAQVNGRTKSSQKLKVFLFNKRSKKTVCVNWMFVDMGYAVSASPKRWWKFKALEKKNGEDEDEDEEEEVDEEEEEEEEEVDDEEEEEEEISIGNFGFKTTRGKSEKKTRDDAKGSDAKIRFLERRKSFKGRRRSKLSAKKLLELHESDKKNEEETSHTEDADIEVDEYQNVLKVKVEVLSAESPSSIHVTFPELMEEFRNLQSKLNEFYQNSPPVASEWTADSVCAVFVSSKNSWYRASVVSTLPDDKVKVFLKDIAQVFVEPASALRELNPSFMKFATCAVKCHLADVAPPGEHWPSVSSEYLLNELEKYKEIYMTKRGQIENRSLPVELWVHKIVPRGALEPSTKEWITLNRLLVSQGLAVPLKQKLWCASLPSDGDAYEGANQEFPEAVDPPPQPPRPVISESSDASDAVVFPPPQPPRPVTSESSDAPDAVVSPPPLRWPPPAPLNKSRFIGIPTYVDFHARIHICDTEQDEESLKMIREALLEEYGNSHPGPEDRSWSPGQMCIARYHFDDSWYRGLILKINEDETYDVLFVDYGNVETCQAPDLRKKLKMEDVPTLSHKIQLLGIVPVSEEGEWPVSVIDALHSLVVDRKCEVTVLETPQDPNEPHVATLKVIEGNVDVGNFLVDQGWTSFAFSNNNAGALAIEYSREKSSSPAPSKEPGRDSDVLQPYAPLRIPDSCCGFFIEVIAIKSETEFFAKITNDESIPSSLKEILKGFESLQKKLLEECSFQPPLKNFTKGQPCCCLNQRIKKWCRGEIDSVGKNKKFFSVFLVDHGNTEFFHKSLLLECKTEWLDLPKMAVACRLANVKKGPTVQKSVYMKALTSCLKETSLFAEIVNKNEEVLEVRLLTERGGPLAYRGMIDKKFMKYIL